MCDYLTTAKMSCKIMDFETALRSVSGTSLGDSEGLQESQAHRRTVPIDENCKASVSHPCSAGFPVSTPETNLV